jgi:hypothetical protein
VCLLDVFPDLFAEWDRSTAFWMLSTVLAVASPFRFRSASACRRCAMASVRDISSAACLACFLAMSATTRLAKATSRLPPDSQKAMLSVLVMMNSVLRKPLLSGRQLLANWALKSENAQRAEFALALFDHSIGPLEQR